MVEINKTSLIISIFFGIGVILLSPQEDILKRILGGSILALVMYTINTKFDNWLKKAGED